MAAAIACAHESDVMHDDNVLIVLRAAVDVLDRARKLEWRTRTWVDVRAGDRVRLPGRLDSEITVQHVSRTAWLASKRNNLMVTFEGRTPMPFVPTDAIEVWLPTQEYDAMMMLGGWENRL